MKLSKKQLRSLIESVIKEETRFEDVSELAHDVNLYEVLSTLYAALEERFGKGSSEVNKWLRELVTDGVESTISDYDGQDEAMMTGFDQDDEGENLRDDYPHLGVPDDE